MNPIIREFQTLFPRPTYADAYLFCSGMFEEAYDDYGPDWIEAYDHIWQIFLDNRPERT